MIAAIEGSTGRPWHGLMTVSNGGCRMQMVMSSWLLAMLNIYLSIHVGFLKALMMSGSVSLCWLMRVCDCVCGCQCVCVCEYAFVLAYAFASVYTWIIASLSSFCFPLHIYFKMLIIIFFFFCMCLFAFSSHCISMRFLF